MADLESRDDEPPKERRPSIRYLPFDYDGRRLHAQVRSTQFTNQWCAPPKDGHCLSIATIGTPESGLSWWTLQVPKDRKLQGTPECDDIVDTESYVRNVTPLQAQRWFESNALSVPMMLQAHVSRTLEGWRIVNANPEISNRLELVRESGEYFTAVLFDGACPLPSGDVIKLLLDLDLIYQVNDEFGLREELEERGCAGFWSWIQEQVRHIHVMAAGACSDPGDSVAQIGEVATDVQPLNSISRDGEAWRFRFGGEDLPAMKHILGILYIAILIANKDRPVSVRNLESGNAPPAFGCDDLLDNEAVTSLHRKLEEKREELEEANEHNAIGASERVAGEIDLLEQQLKAAMGLAGRTRKLDEDLEKVRHRVGKAIQFALKRLKGASRMLHDHLKDSLKGCRGATPSYEPRPSLEWSLPPIALLRGASPERARESDSPDSGA